MSTPQDLEATNTSSPNVNRHTEIITICVVFSSLSLIAVSLRLLSRRLKGVSLHYDDYLVIAAWVTIITFAEAAMVAASTRFAGLGQHISSVTDSQILGFRKGFYILPLLQTTALFLGKISVLVLLHRIFITRRFQLTARILSAIVLAWYLTSLFGYTFICYPIQMNWNPRIHGHCGNLPLLTVIVPIPWVVTDFAILIAPIPVVRKLQLPRLEKIGLCALFLTGGATCIIAAYRYSKLFWAPQDLTWDITDVAIWSVVETNATVFCACIVAIKPALRYLLPEKMISSARSGWSKIVSSRSSKSASAEQHENPSTLGSYRYRKHSTPKLPLFNESADRFGPRKLDEPKAVPLHQLYAFEPPK